MISRLFSQENGQGSTNASMLRDPDVATCRKDEAMGAARLGISIKEYRELEEWKRDLLKGPIPSETSPKLLK
jgi:hypothetical protein